MRQDAAARHAETLLRSRASSCRPERAAPFRLRRWPASSSGSAFSIHELSSQTVAPRSDRASCPGCDPAGPARPQGQLRAPNARSGVSRPIHVLTPHNAGRSESAENATVQFISLGYSRQSMNFRPILSSSAACHFPNIPPLSYACGSTGNQRPLLCWSPSASGKTGQKVLLAVKNMGGESEAAWRTLLNDLANRGLKTPRKLIQPMTPRVENRKKQSAKFMLTCVL
jgi:hypothetical protein